VATPINCDMATSGSSCLARTKRLVLSVTLWTHSRPEKYRSRAVAPALQLVLNSAEGASQKSPGIPRYLEARVLEDSKDL